MHPSYEAWKTACNAMKQQHGRLKSYLQWYPFSILSESNWEKLRSEQFWATYIKDGAFVACSSMRFVSKGYVQKQGVAFRDSVLVSPVLFLYLLAFGIEYQKDFIDRRTKSPCEYAGDLNAKQPHYKRSYQRFCNNKRIAKAKYAYYLKTDISNFFGSISVDRLISKMQEHSNNSFSATDGLFIRALLLYCGQGKYPTIQNHPTLSYLATKVYLMDIDEELLQYAKRNKSIDSFTLIRYVDDLFLFFNVKPSNSPYQAKEDLLNNYADILRSNGLTLNQNKVEFGPTSSLSLTNASESCIDYTEPQTENEIDNASERIAHLFEELARRSNEHDYRQEDCNEAIESAFAGQSGTTTSITAFRSCLYHASDSFHAPSVINSIKQALGNGKVVLSYNTAELTKCILNTNDGALVKKMLNMLFCARRDGTWSSIDALIAINYLISRNMAHTDLLEVLKEVEPNLHLYITRFCKTARYATNPASDTELKLLHIIADDKQCKILYVSQLYQKSTHNYFEQVSYLRTFFDRFSTLYKRKILHQKQRKFLYSEKELKAIYSSIDGSEETIRKAETLRRNNPLIHASSELIRDSYEEDIYNVSKSLRELMLKLLESSDLPLKQ